MHTDLNIPAVFVREISAMEEEGIEIFRKNSWKDELLLEGFYSIHSTKIIQLVYAVSSYRFLNGKGDEAFQGNSFGRTQRYAVDFVER